MANEAVGALRDALKALSGYEDYNDNEVNPQAERGQVALAALAGNVVLLRGRIEAAEATLNERAAALDSALADAAEGVPGPLGVAAKALRQAREAFDAELERIGYEHG